MSELTITNLKSPAEGLEAVLCALADGIRADIAALPDDSATRIHDIRVRSKKLWSLSKLARRHSDKASTREFKVLLREIKNSFSGSRDEEVMRTHLLRLLPDGEGAKTCEAAGLSSGAEGTNFQTPGKTMESAEKLVLLVRSPGWESLTIHDLCHRFSRSYRAARKAMVAAHRNTDDELMHDWRKRVKDVFYQACAMNALAPVKEIVEPMDDLADVLGKHHDMAVLLAHLVRHDTGEEAQSVVSREKEELEQTAWGQGRDLLGRRTSDLEEALEKAATE